jgi:hypothetical protein
LRFGTVQRMVFAANGFVTNELAFITRGSVGGRVP